MEPAWGQDVNATLDDKISKTNPADQSIDGKLIVNSDLKTLSSLWVGTREISDVSGNLFSTSALFTFLISGTLLPQITGTSDIGTNNLQFNNVYCGAMRINDASPILKTGSLLGLYESDGSTGILYYNGTDMVLGQNKELYPSGATSDLGKSGNRWDKLYVNSIDIGTPIKCFINVMNGPLIHMDNQSPNFVIAKNDFHKWDFTPSTLNVNNYAYVPLNIPEGAIIKTFSARASAYNASLSGMVVELQIIRTDDGGGTETLISELEWNDEDWSVKYNENINHTISKLGSYGYDSVEDMYYVKIRMIRVTGSISSQDCMAYHITVSYTHDKVITT